MPSHVCIMYHVFFVSTGAKAIVIMIKIGMIVWRFKFSFCRVSPFRTEWNGMQVKFLGLLTYSNVFVQSDRCVLCVTEELRTLILSKKN